MRSDVVIPIVLPYYSYYLYSILITLITYLFSFYSSLVLLAFVLSLACACVPPSPHPSVHVLLAYQHLISRVAAPSGVREISLAGNIASF